MSFPLCKFFRSEQGCKFGNKCRYRHSSSESPPGLPHSHFQYQQDGPVRKPNFDSFETSSLPSNYLPNSREDGSSVSNPQGFAHARNLVDFYSAPRHNEGSVTPSNSCGAPQSNFNLNTHSHAEKRAVSARPAVQQEPSQKPCHYFARHGTCCFGSRCRFEHVNPDRPPRFQQNRPSQRSSLSKTGDSQAGGNEVPKANNGEAEEEKEVRHEDHANRKPKSGNGYQAGSVSFAPAGSAAHEKQTPEAGIGDVKALPTQSRSDKVCQFYLRGWCVRGRRCRFLHPRRQRPSAGKELESTEGQQKTDPGKGYEKEDTAAQSSVESAQNPDAEASPKDQKKPSPKPSRASKPRPPYVPQGVKKYQRDEVDDVEACRLRRSEIDALMKRFPKNKVKVNRDCADYFQCVVSFSPTDPDWPYDVKVFELQVDIPSDYPFEMLSVSLPVEQELPETVRRYVEVCVEEWLEEKQGQLQDKRQLELVFRPFLRWLDRSLEDVVTEGLRQLKREMVAKASGLEFISAKQLQKQYPGQKSDSADPADNDEEYDEDEETSSGSQDGYDTSDDDEDDDDENSEEEEGEDCEEEESEGRDAAKSKSKRSQQDRVKAMMADPDRRGTEVSLKNLQLKESAATLYLEKICLSIQCERCKGTAEFMASSGRANMVQCSKCNQTQMATFRPAMAHHFSSVIGYLDLEACLPHDVILQNCSAVLACLHCSKDTRPGGVLPGSPQDHWCRVCHCKLRMATDGIRFTQLEPSRAVQSLGVGSVKVVVTSRKRVPKDPAIQEGKPLPSFGTCKHYKKSYRWLRFPCCGKCYPCDICHDSKEDHEMKFANRMICGFCCREQVFAAERPCKGCDMNLTKVHTTHWEGGQGCRDKITMSRNDKKKHSNMSKTVSKHAQKVKEFKAKKKTKLRHA